MRAVPNPPSLLNGYAWTTNLRQARDIAEVTQFRSCPAATRDAIGASPTSLPRTGHPPGRSGATPTPAPASPLPEPAASSAHSPQVGAASCASPETPEPVICWRPPDQLGSVAKVDLDLR